MQRLLPVYMFLCSVFVATPNFLSAQEFLSLEHEKKEMRHVFVPGDFIRLRAGIAKKNQYRHYFGIIEEIRDSFIVILKTVDMKHVKGNHSSSFRERIDIDRIEAVYINSDSYWNRFRRVFYTGTMAAGSMMIGVSVANGLIEKEPPNFTSLSVVVGMMTTGLVVRYIGRNKYRVGKRWNIRVTHYGVPEESYQNKIPSQEE